MKDNKDKLYSGLLGIIGFLLSPLSWWNDLFINIPIAYLCASFISFIYRCGFLKAFVISYWATNIVGLMLLGKGISRFMRNGSSPHRYTIKDIIRDTLFSMGYTFMIVILVKIGIIRPFNF